jgi:hypothetical protein
MYGMKVFKTTIRHKRTVPYAPLDSNTNMLSLSYVRTMKGMKE